MNKKKYIFPKNKAVLKAELNKEKRLVFSEIASLRDVEVPDIKDRLDVVEKEIEDIEKEIPEVPGTPVFYNILGRVRNAGVVLNENTIIASQDTLDSFNNTTLMTYDDAIVEMGESFNGHRLPTLLEMQAIRQNILAINFGLDKLEDSMFINDNRIFHAWYYFNGGTVYPVDIIDEITYYPVFNTVTGNVEYINEANLAKLRPVITTNVLQFITPYSNSNLLTILDDGVVTGYNPYQNLLKVAPEQTVEDVLNAITSNDGSDQHRTIEWRINDYFLPSPQEIIKLLETEVINEELEDMGQLIWTSQDPEVELNLTAIAVNKETKVITEELRTDNHTVLPIRMFDELEEYSVGDELEGGKIFHKDLISQFTEQLELYEYNDEDSNFTEIGNETLSYSHLHYNIILDYILHAIYYVNNIEDWDIVTENNTLSFYRQGVFYTPDLITELIIQITINGITYDFMLYSIDYFLNAGEWRLHIEGQILDDEGNVEFIDDIENATNMKIELFDYDVFRYLQVAPKEYWTETIWIPNEVRVDNTEEGLYHGYNNSQLIIDAIGLEDEGAITWVQNIPGVIFSELDLEQNILFDYDYVSIITEERYNDYYSDWTAYRTRLQIVETLSDSVVILTDNEDINISTAMENTIAIYIEESLTADELKSEIYSDDGSLQTYIIRRGSTEITGDTVIEWDDTFEVISEDTLNTETYNILVNPV